VTATVPLTPDAPAAWVRFPNDARRTTFTGGLTYQINVTFCVPLNDVDAAQELLDTIYDAELWAAIERYDTDEWADINVVRLDEPYQLALDDGVTQMLAVDLPIDLIP
jgi:hypothetical protein